MNDTMIPQAGVSISGSSAQSSGQFLLDCRAKSQVMGLGFRF